MYQVYRRIHDFSSAWSRRSSLDICESSIAFTHCLSLVGIISVYCTVVEHGSPGYAKERIVHIGTRMQNDNAVELASISNKTENYVFYTWQQTPSLQMLQVILKVPFL